MSKIIVTKYNDLILLIEYEGGNPVRINCSRDYSASVGDIYVGRVNAVKKELNAAFVDFMEGYTGFLPLDQCAFGIKQGDLVPVQVTGEPVKTKGYKLSSFPEVSGNYLVFTTKHNEIHISSKIDKSEGEAIKEKLLSDFPKREFGIIIRTKASLDKYDEIKTEYENTGAVFLDVIKYGKSRTLYSRLYKEKKPFIKLISEKDISDIEEIVCGDDDIYQELINVYPDKTRIFDDSRISFNACFRIEHAIELATSKKVNLPCGGYLIIEPTEALTVIDVNSGKITGKNNKNEMVDLVNKEAATEVARQLVLRNISGMIIIDFINYDDPDKEEELVTYFRGALREDKCKTKVLGFTKLKFLEMTRQKINASIYDYI